MEPPKFICNKCNKEFAHKKYLQKHLRRKTSCSKNNTEEDKLENKEDKLENKEDNTEEDNKEENNNKEEDNNKKEEDVDSLINLLDNTLKIGTNISSNNETIIKIQKWFRKICNKSSIKCKLIIELLNNNHDIMQKCYYEILSISKKFPPAKNENKFIYGKLCEKSLLNTFNNIGFKCEDLDQTHLSGSEYKNDIKMLKLKYSIKTSKNKGDVRLINTLSTAKHNINMTLMLCVINEKKLYIFPSHIVNQRLYLKKDAGSISYKGSLFKWIDTNQSEYIFTFPELTEEQNININNIQEVMIYEYLYKTFVKELI